MITDILRSLNPRRYLILIEREVKDSGDLSSRKLYGND